MSRQELARLEIICQEYAIMVGRQEPLKAWRDYVEVLSLGVDASFVANNIRGASGGQGMANNKALAEVKAALRLDELINSYSLPQMAAEYVEGTRQWLYIDANRWLSEGTLDSPSSRMFILAAEPGMGKSVFSAVVDTKLVARKNFQMERGDKKLYFAHHFFKVTS